MPLEAVVFDLDGTLVDERSSWEWVHHHFAVNNEENVQAFLDGKLDDLEFMAADIQLWQEAAGGPIHLEEIERILESAPMMEGAGRLVDALHAEGIPTAIVSGGIDVLAERVAEILDIPLCISNSLVADDEGYLTGSGVCRVRLDDKASPAFDAIAQMGATAGACAAVGNSRFDVGMFEAAGYGIAFAPLDPEVMARADLVIEEKDLALVVEPLMARLET